MTHHLWLLVGMLVHVAARAADCVVTVEVGREYPLASDSWTEAVKAFSEQSPAKELAVQDLKFTVPSSDGLFTRVRIQVTEQSGGKTVIGEGKFAVDQYCEGAPRKLYVGVVSPSEGDASDIQQIRDDPDVEKPPSPLRAAFELARTVSASEGRRIRRQDSAVVSQWDLLAAAYALKEFRYLRDKIGSSNWPLMSDSLSATAAWHRKLIAKTDNSFASWARDKSLSDEADEVYEYYRSRWAFITTKIVDKAQKFDLLVRFNKSVSDDDRATREDILKAIGLSFTEPENSISAVAARIPPATAKEDNTRAAIQEHIDHIQAVANASNNPLVKRRVEADSVVLQHLIR